jgi:hypothetical protein
VWADGDDLLLDTRERYLCALDGIRAAVSELASTSRGNGSKDEPEAAAGLVGGGGGKKEVEEGAAAAAVHAMVATAALSTADGAVGGVHDETVSRLARVIRAPPVLNYQTVYGVIMIPSEQLIVPIS